MSAKRTSSLAAPKTPGIPRRSRPYPEYRDSGVPWLGEVPAHWQDCRLKYAARVVMGHSPASEEYSTDANDLPFLQGNADFGLLFPSLRVFCPTVTKCVPKDSLLLSVRAPVGVLNIADQCYGIGRGLCAVVPDKTELLSDFTWYLLHVIRTELATLATGSTYEAVTASEVANMTVLLLALAEQRAIAAFLDRQTQRIDELIARKRRLIELLQEKRAALISHAVTKGLDPAAPMKPSGIEWLGAVPAHWEVKRLRYLCSIQTGDKDTVDAIDDGQFPFFVRSQTVERIDSYTFDCEAVLTAGDGVGVGKVFHYCNGRFDVHQRAYVTHGFKGIVGRFLYYFLKEHFHKVALEGSAKSTVDSLRRHMFTDFPAPFPSLDEQGAIVGYHDVICAEMNALTASIDSAVIRLHEYRQALISAAVTGKIDVREEARNG